jgi:agmatine deiminase
VYAEIVRALHRYERVEILCHSDDVAEGARTALAAHGVDARGYRLHVTPNDRVWVRDSGPTGVHRPDGSLAWVNWDFNAWAKYDDYAHDVQLGRVFERVSGVPRLEPPTCASCSRAAASR